MKSKKADVEFFADPQHIKVFPHPRPAGKFVPDYFAKLKPQSDNHPNSGTVKRCIPFLDAINQGFVIPLWCDVFVRATNGELNIDFPKNLPMDCSLSPHGEVQIRDHPLANTPYGNIPVKWHNPWGIKTRAGWSVLITSPLNRLETRFKILDGIVDTDEYYNQINFPFIWTGGDGEFLLPKGMPLVQVIPFERKRFTYDIVEQDNEKQSVVIGKLGTVLRNAYRTMFWHKK